METQSLISARHALPALRIALVLGLALLAGCSDGPWNNPYPAGHAGRNIIYDVFSERPKHLDPVSSYSANEYVFIGQIYEPPLQYHFLKRPYELVPLTATEVPEPVYFDADGNVLPDDAPSESVARAVYRIRIQPGIRYQPHPAFATDDAGKPAYHALVEADLDGVHRLSDFPRTGTRELVAADYVYQIKRMAHPRVHSPIGGLMAGYILGLADLGERLAAQYGESRAWIDLREHPLAGVRVIDRYTYEIVLREKYPQFIYWLSMSFFAPMPWEAEYFYEQPGMHERNITLDWYPVGTGAFMLVENNPNRRMIMARNPHFRGEPYPAEGEPEDATAGLLADAGKPMPFVDMAYYSLEKEVIPTWNKFLQGYYDTTGISSDSFDQAIRFSADGNAGLTERMRERGIELMTAVQTSIFYTGFNMVDPVVGGDSERARLLRRAISIALDFEEYISIFANGRGIPAQGPLPPGIFGYREGCAGVNEYVYECRDDRLRRRPLAEARALMREAGYPEGIDPQTGNALVLYLDSPAAGPGSKAQFDWLRKQFSRLGIQLVIRATDYNRFQEKMRKGTAQIFQWGWNADYPDPENLFFLLYGPNAKVESGGENAANYMSAEFDALYGRMQSLPNGSQRAEVIDRMLAIVRRDAPWIWGFHPVGFSLYHSWYGNAKPNLMANNTLKYKRVDPAAREQKRRAWNRPLLWPLWLLLGLLVASIVPAWMSYRRREKAAAL